MTRKTFLLITIIVFSNLYVACQTPESVIPTIKEKDIEAIRQANKQYQQAELANDWHTVTALYTEKAIRMLPEGPTIQGREAILKDFKARPHTITEYDQQIEEIDGCGNLAIVRGVFSYTVDGQGDLLRGSDKYMAIYRKQLDGTWLIYRDIFNFDSPDP